MIPKIETRLVADLIPYASNSRTHSDAQIAQIAASIREFGWTNPILIDGDNTIIAGHGRLLAARKLGMEDVPAIILDHLSKAQQRALVIADNQLALNAGWDIGMLKAEIEDLNLEGFNLELLGFDDKFLDGLLEPEPTEGLTDEDAVPEVPLVPKTVLGDVWVLGNHRLMCGDSTSVDALEKLTEKRLVDMWLTDPPYNVAYEGGTKDKLTIQNDNMGDDQFREFLRDAYVAADSVMKPGAVFYIWHADLEGYNFRGAAKDAGWQVRQCLVWKSHPWLWADRITIGSMNLAYTDGKKALLIYGQRIASKPLSLSLTSQAVTVSIRQ